MERGIVSQGELLQGQEAGMVEQVCTGQEDCLSGTLAAGSHSCLPAVSTEREWSQADGTLIDLPVSGLHLDFLPVFLSELMATPFI